MQREVLVFQGRIIPALVIKEYFLSPKKKSLDELNGSGTGNCGFPIDSCFDVVFFIWLILIVL